ncbi:MAG: ABC transporter permease [Saprospirales bacterium]|nr:ABC transporter permease [Saprospirales bacterium]
MVRAKKTSGFWRSQVMERFRSKRSAVWSLRLLYVFFAIALLGDFLANEKPLYCVIEGKTYFPVLHQYGVDLGLTEWSPELVRARWRELDYESVVFPPIPYSATTRDIKNTHFANPFRGQRVASPRFWHWLGTDQLGRDVAAGLIAGTRIALLVGLGAMALATLIGLFLGTLAGYWGDHGLKTSWIRLVLQVVGLYFGLFFGFISRAYSIGEANAAGGVPAALFTGLIWLVGMLVLANGLGFLIERVFRLRKQVRIPVDLLVMRSVEVMESIPGLLLILALAALIRKPSIWYVMLIIGLVGWTSIAQFVRAEMLKVRRQTYIEAAQALGLRASRIMFRHALPNALSPVLILIAFGVARAILSEATLSFLGIGLGPEEVTWGKLLSEARSNFNAWWLAVFPGVAIFFMVLLFNLLGEGLSDALDPKRDESGPNS